MGIDKTTAALLFAYGYKLIDKEGNEVNIIGILTGHLMCVKKKKPFEIKLNRIGNDYFILCRKLSSLTETIEHEGEKVIPFTELENEFRQPGFLVDLEMDIWTGYAMFSNEGIGLYHGVTSAFFDKLYSYHFPLSGLDESQIKYIKD